MISSSNYSGARAILFVKAGIASGFFTCVAYPVLSFAPLPRLPMTVLVALLGPALGIASVGLREALRVHRYSVASYLACIFNTLAGALLTAMLLVQLAVRQYAQGEDLPTRLVGVWLGLDVAWDVYIGLGTLLFAAAMVRHPRFGIAFAVPGLSVAALLLAMNLYTFPVPPAESGLFDVGPLVGLWYLAVTIQLWRLLPWIAQQCGSKNAESI
jgi:hypothetical protein